jgi:hypothetical protein
MAAMENRLTLGDAARAIGVSQDTLRRWDRVGKLRTHRDERNGRLVPRSLPPAIGSEGSCDSVEELGLAKAVEATPTVKATSVMIEREW